VRTVDGTSLLDIQSPIAKKTRIKSQNRLKKEFEIHGQEFLHHPLFSYSIPEPIDQYPPKLSVID
jgi:hypothetical protein